MDAICLVSGGLDSYLAWWVTKSTPVFVDYGQIYIESELQAARELYKDLHVIQIRGLPQQRQRYVPCRNLIFSALASHWDCNIIYVAGMDDDMDQDKSPREFAHMSLMLSRYSQRGLTVTSPWWGHTKASAVANYLVLGGPADTLKLTYSCYSQIKCNQCDACYRWALALLSNHIDVPVPSISCIIDRGIKQLWHRPASSLHQLLRALSFTNIEYSVFYVKDNHSSIDDINTAFLSGQLVILSVPCGSHNCTVFADNLRKQGYLFHGVVPSGQADITSGDI